MYRQKLHMLRSIYTKITSYRGKGMVIWYTIYFYSGIQKVH